MLRSVESDAWDSPSPELMDLFAAGDPMARADEPISGFEMRVPPLRPDREPLLLHVTILRMPGPRPELFTLVHVLQPIDEAGRAARTLGPWRPTRALRRVREARRRYLTL